MITIEIMEIKMEDKTDLDLKKLLKIASNSTASAKADYIETVIKKYTSCSNVYTQLCNLLIKRNGFYAFENALNVYGISKESCEFSNMNNMIDWDTKYGIPKGSCLFGQDAFGFQFFINKKGVYQLNTEDGSTECLGLTLTDWAKVLLSDYDYITGWSLAKTWQTFNGEIKNGFRLFPKIPFLLGGKFEINNLYEANIEEGLSSRLNLYEQTKNLKDGQEIDLIIKGSI